MVGYPIPGVTLKLADDGEILAQGPNVMPGYFANPEATAQALPGDGWFHTGDLGELIGAGLKLVTRKDRVFKMLNAEKVVPTELENRLAGMNPYVRHVIVVGAGRDFLAALIYPDFFRIEQEFGSDRALADSAVKRSLRETILRFNREHPVKYERFQPRRHQQGTVGGGSGAHPLAQAALSQRPAGRRGVPGGGVSAQPRMRLPVPAPGDASGAGPAPLLGGKATHPRPMP
jgi:acyl-CoA synthetase (AMP-forming)/AMP-acid ligase II